MSRPAFLLLLLATACGHADDEPIDTDTDTDVIDTDAGETDAEETDTVDTDDTDVEVVLPPTFVAGEGGWWETSPELDLDLFASATLTLTFRSTGDGEVEFDGAADDGDVLQLWTTPGTTSVPFTVPTRPSGTVAKDGEFSYTVEVDLTGVASTEKGLALRPQSKTLGVVGADKAELIANTITLVP